MLLYLEETEEFTRRLREKTGLEDLHVGSAMLTRRLQAKVSQRPGLVLLIRFFTRTPDRAIGEFGWFWLAYDAPAGQLSSFELERRDGQWVFVKWADRISPFGRVEADASGNSRPAVLLTGL